MSGLWVDEEAAACGGDPLDLRVYTSRLLGRDPALVMHGGGNTSVKSTARDVFGDVVDVLYVKGSGWDLATIEREGFAPVKLDVLKRMAELESLSDSAMVRGQRAALVDPNAPNPSVEAILHAVIPFTFVDHTHADDVVLISNTPGGAAKIQEVYGSRVLIVPYVMPGFQLAKTIFQMTADTDWRAIDGLILMNHGVFTFGDDARQSYERMIDLVTLASEYLNRQQVPPVAAAEPVRLDPVRVSEIRREVSSLRGCPVIARLDRGPEAVGFSGLESVEELCDRGPLTPDHVIRTKRTAWTIAGETGVSARGFASRYRAYFQAHAEEGIVQLDPAPRVGIWPGHGTFAFGDTVKAAAVIADITRHTARAIQLAEHLGGWQALPPRDVFAVEYWELEQAKLNKAGRRPPLTGKVALVTGAGSGIGRATAQLLRRNGAAVSGLDLTFSSESADPGILSLRCDVTNVTQVRDAIAQTVERFGGIDILVSNAGNFPRSREIADMDSATWSGSLDLNLTSHMTLLRECLPILKNGIDPAVVFTGSKNVPAPGPGAAAYSVAKAGLTQLCRAAALELGRWGIRVNVVHPDAVFDTGIWDEETLRARAAHYGMSIDDYKRRNVLAEAVKASDVARAICALCDGTLSKTTGAQLPVDGGNDRVI